VTPDLLLLGGTELLPLMALVAFGAE